MNDINQQLTELYADLKVVEYKMEQKDKTIETQKQKIAALWRAYDKHLTQVKQLQAKVNLYKGALDACSELPPQEKINEQ